VLLHLFIHSPGIGNQEFRFGIQFDTPELVPAGEFSIHIISCLLTGFINRLITEPSFNQPRLFYWLYGRNN